MGEIASITKELGGMPAVALIAIVILAAFGLAAFAIFAVMRITGRASHGN